MTTTTESLFTTWITAQGDCRAHAVTDEAVADGRATGDGVYQALADTGCSRCRWCARPEHHASAAPACYEHARSHATLSDIAIASRTGLCACS